MMVYGVDPQKRIMEGVFRLWQIVGLVPHFAEVAVRVEPIAHDDVAVSEGVFAWRFEAYGPNAVSGGSGDQQLVSAAIEGVRYVLARCDGGGRLVTVTRVVDTVDTRAADVKLAAAAATCQALGVELERPPFIDASGVVFPD